MILRKLIVIGLVLLPACGWWWLQHQHITQLNVENARTRAQWDQVKHETQAIQARRQTISSAMTNVQPSVSPRGKASATQASPATSQIPVTRPAVPTILLSKANLKRLRVQPVTDDFQLTDEVAAILGMSPAERQAMDQAIRQLVDKHQLLDLAKVKPSEEHLTSDPGRKTTYKVPAYSQEGQLLAKELFETSQQVLGSNRTDILLQYADLNALTADNFEPFGQTEKTITFLDRFTEDGGRGDCRIFLRVVDTRSGLTLTTSFANQDDTIPKNWRHLIQNISPGH